MGRYPNSIVNVRNKKSVPEIRIGLNESHIRKCSSKYNFRKQCSRKETNELFAQGYSFFKKKRRLNKKSVFEKQTSAFTLCVVTFFFHAKREKKAARLAHYESVIANCVIAVILTSYICYLF